MSSKWLIAGYSFRDVPVNSLLVDALDVRRSLGEPDPAILVIGHGEAADVAKQVNEVLGDVDELRVDGQGVPAAVEADEWTGWAT